MLNQEQFEQKIWLIKLLKNWREVLFAMNNDSDKYKPPLIFKNGLRLNLFKENREYQGLILYLVKDIFVNKMYFQNNFYQPQSGDILIDIGAHIGLFPIFCHSQTEHNFTIHCFEPFSENLKLLTQNLEENHLENSVKIYPYAVFNQEGNQDLWSHINTHSYYNPSFFRNYVTPEGENPIFLGNVPCISLDKCMEMTGAKTIDFLKIHCEGSELEILESASPETLKRIKKIAVVCHQKLRPKCNQIIDKILSSQNFTTKYIKTYADDLEGGIIQAVNMNFQGE
jgi:FkbM family methyltransferase